MEVRDLGGATKKSILHEISVTKLNTHHNENAYGITGYSEMVSNRGVAEPLVP